MQCRTAFTLLLWLLCVATVTCMEAGENYAIRLADQEWLNSLFYIPTSSRVRREYRMLSEKERTKYHTAFLKLKRDRTVIPNKFDLLASLHARRPSRNSAHRGTGFLAWHRVYLLMFENALREQEPNITIPYWDCTLESVLPVPRETSLFSEDFMGNGDGFVTIGAFKDWTVQSGKLYRTVGALHAPLGDRNISHMFKQDFIRNISYPLFGKDQENVFELIHNRVHHWIGGEMRSIETAADDPIFQLYHSFVSYVWEEFRGLQRQKGIDPETDWDDYYGQGRHHRYSPMGLGNLMASDGASNIFAENIVFEKRPTCNKEAVDCGTPYLYCNVLIEKCSPWTIKEYGLIKTKAQSINTTFKEAVKPFIKSKLKKGFQELVAKGEDIKQLPGVANIYINDDIADLFIVLENPTTPKPVSHPEVDLDNLWGLDNHEDDHRHSHDDTEDVNNGHQATDDTIQGQDHHNEVEGHSHDNKDDSHEDHDHSHKQNIIQGGSISNRKKSAFEMFLEKYCVVILGGLVIFRVGFAFITKCASEKCCGMACSSSKRQKYHMDGIVNVNFDEEGNKDTPHANKVDTSVNRSDNVYTITITASNHDSEVNSTFVRFAKYSNAEVHTPTEPDKLTSQTGNTLGNYLDMTYASHYSQDVNGISSDMFEHEPTENEDRENEDFDTSYHSIENENFDFIRAAITEAGESVSEDSCDLFDTYDNIMNVESNREPAEVCNRDQPEACVGTPTPAPRSKRNNTDIQHDDGYVHHLPATHM